MIHKLPTEPQGQKSAVTASTKSLQRIRQLPERPGFQTTRLSKLKGEGENLVSGESRETGNSEEPAIKRPGPDQ